MPAKIHIPIFRGNRSLVIDSDGESLFVRMGVRGDDGWHWVTVSVSKPEAMYIKEALEYWLEELRKEGKLFSDERPDSNGNRESNGRSQEGGSQGGRAGWD